MNESAIKIYFGLQPRDAVGGLTRFPWFPGGTPEVSFYRGGPNKRTLNSWLEMITHDPMSVNALKWQIESGGSFLVRPGIYSTHVHAGGSVTLPGLFATFGTWPFEVCSVGRILNWREVAEARHTRFTLVDGNSPFAGVAVAFKGEEGHSRLVSRRWLEHGPWALLRREDVDLSVVLFHDPDLSDPVVALDQAYPGHQRMGISPIGGYMHVAHKATTELSGTYLEAERRLVIVVHGREVSQAEMLDACALRRDAGGTERPVETVTYLFAEESAARAHLHELWLRGLEVRCIRAGREVRLDEDYKPTPEVPSWVPGVRARWQALLDGM